MLLAPIPVATAQKPAELRAAVETDLAQLGIDRIHVVNLRRLDLGPGLKAEGDQIVDLDDQLAEMVALRDEGKIGAIGISTVPLAILERALPGRHRLRAERLQPARPPPRGHARVLRRQRDHLEENIGAGGVELAADALARLDAVYDTPRRTR